ncbi:MAG: hypothetical protein DRI61_09765, partial [Chloroflexi bacterium]
LSVSLESRVTDADGKEIVLNEKFIERIRREFLKEFKRVGIKTKQELVDLIVKSIEENRYSQYIYVSTKGKVVSGIATYREGMYYVLSGRRKVPARRLNLYIKRIEGKIIWTFVDSETMRVIASYPPERDEVFVSSFKQEYPALERFLRKNRDYFRSLSTIGKKKLSDGGDFLSEDSELRVREKIEEYKVMASSYEEEGDIVTAVKMYKRMAECYEILSEFEKVRECDEKATELMEPQPLESSQLAGTPIRSEGVLIQPARILIQTSEQTRNLHDGGITIKKFDGSFKEGVSKFNRFLNGGETKRTLVVLISGNDKESAFLDYLFFYFYLRIYWYFRGFSLKIIKNATSQDLRRVLKDSSIRYIAVAGHGNWYGWRATDRYIDEDEIKEWVLQKDFYPKEMFITYTCGTPHTYSREVKIEDKFGYHIVKNPLTNLFGIKEIFLWSWALLKPSLFSLQELKGPDTYILRFLRLGGEYFIIFATKLAILMYFLNIIFSLFTFGEQIGLILSLILSNGLVAMIVAALLNYPDREKRCIIRDEITKNTQNSKNDGGLFDNPFKNEKNRNGGVIYSGMSELINEIKRVVKEGNTKEIERLASVLREYQENQITLGFTIEGYTVTGKILPPKEAIQMIEQLKGEIPGILNGFGEILSFEKAIKGLEEGDYLAYIYYFSKGEESLNLVVLYSTSKELLKRYKDGGKSSSSIEGSDPIFTEKVAVKIVKALQRCDLHTVVQLLEEFFEYNWSSMSRLGSHLDETAIIEEIWRDLKEHIGSIESISKMRPEEFAEKMGVIKVNLGEALFMLDRSSSELLRKVREVTGGSESLWEMVLRTLKRDAPKSIPSEIWLFHPSVNKEGIYYSPQAYQKMGRPLTKSAFFHEFLELKFVENKLVDPVFCKLFRHAHPKIVEEELKFASMMGELNLRIEVWKRHIKSVENPMAGITLQTLRIVKKYSAQLNEIIEKFISGSIPRPAQNTNSNLHPSGKSLSSIVEELNKLAQMVERYISLKYKWDNKYRERNLLTIYLKALSLSLAGELVDTSKLEIEKGDVIVAGKRVFVALNDTWIDEIEFSTYSRELSLTEGCKDNLRFSDIPKEVRLLKLSRQPAFMVPKDGGKSSFWVGLIIEEREKFIEESKDRRNDGGGKDKLTLQSLLFGEKKNDYKSHNKDNGGNKVFHILFSSRHRPDKNYNSNDTRGDIKMDKVHRFAPLLSKIIEISRKSIVKPIPNRKVYAGNLPVSRGENIPTTKEAKITFAPSRKKFESILNTLNYITSIFDLSSVISNPIMLGTSGEFKNRKNNGRKSPEFRNNQIEVRNLHDGGLPNNRKEIYKISHQRLFVAAGVSSVGAGVIFGWATLAGNIWLTLLIIPFAFVGAVFFLQGLKIWLSLREHSPPEEEL